MLREKFNLQTEVVSSDDMKHTYEVKKTWDEKKKKAIVLELYPTISADRPSGIDSSLMLLMNHAVNDFNWGSFQILNLYSTVFTGKKPLASKLFADEENVAYIEEIIESADKKNTDIVIAWGCSLGTHAITNRIKKDILLLLKKKKIESNTKCFVPEFYADQIQCGTHPLFLGLHYGKEKWKLEMYPVDEVIKALEIEPTNTKGEKNVSENKK